MAEKPDIAIVGPGAVGSTLATAAHRAGYRITALGVRSRSERAEMLATAVGAKILPPLAAATEARLVLLTVRDDAIEPLCKQLATGGGLARRPIVAHCSGAWSSDALRSASVLGCPVGSMHPLQTFPDEASALERLAGTYFFVEGDPPAAAVLEDFARALGGVPLRIESAAKTLYHAAAVLGANYLTALLDAALRILESLGLASAQARQALAPLVRATLENTLQNGPAAALTGPIARGDAQTVARHVEALHRAQPDIERLYQAVGRYTVELACRKGTLDEPALQALRSALGK